MGEPPPLPESSLIPTIPSNRMITTATAPGTSQGGRSARIPPPPTGGRGTDAGLRAGGGTVGVRAGGGAVGVRVVSTYATPVPRGSAGIASPGFHAGCSTGVQVCSAGGAGGATCAGGGAGAGGAAGAGGEVEKGEAGKTGAAGATGGVGAGSSHVGAL